MILRLSPEHRAELIRAGGGQFEPMPGRPMQEYVAVPEAVLADDESLRRWVTRADEFVPSLAP